MADAAAEAQRAVEAADQGWTAALPGARAVLALALLEQGDRPGAAELLSLTDSEGPWRNTVTEAFICHARACLGIVDDEPEGAAEHALDAGRILVAHLGAVTPAVLPWRSTAAIALHAAGDRDAALPLVSEELELARAFGAARPIGIALRTIGMVTGGPAGLEHLQDAAEMLSGTPWRLESARALADLGAALLRADRRSEAAAPLNEALGLADRCGAVTLAERVRQDLVAAGARPRRQARGSTVLTPAEHRVARLAAGGLTNREIAQKLFVGTRAVEFHLGNVYGKFGISSRQDLATALGDETESGSR
jgi:DNA-binding CsgD family transcriptional regulator